MTTMVAELYDALLDAGASDAKARRAAEAMASHEDRFHRVDRRFDQLQVDLERRFAALQAEVTLLRWMTVTGIGLDLAVLVELFAH